MLKEYKGNWQKIKWDKKGEPYLTYQSKKYFLSQFANFTSDGHYQFQDGYTVYLLEIDEYGENGRITYCPPSW